MTLGPRLVRRNVALKVLREGIADDSARRRLVREAQAAAALDHPNICAIYEVGECDGRSFIAMQHIEGESLADRLRNGPLDVETVLAIRRRSESRPLKV
jgi:serine/threonine protein kinase